MSSNLQGWTDFSANINENAFTGNGSKLIILFREVPRFMKAKSEAMGRAVYETRTHITKIVPGDKGLVVDRPITQKDKMEFPVEWARWEQTKQNKMPGIPIEHWHAISDTQKMEFKANHIHTVEQLAALDDQRISQYMGGLDLREKARRYVAATNESEQVAAANAKVKALEDKLSELTAMVEKLTAPEPKPEAVTA